MSTTIDFNHLNLAEVNPDIPALPDGEYNFVVIDAEKKEFTYKNDVPNQGKNAGDIGVYIKFGLSVTDDAENAGRRVYNTLFADDRTARYLRLIQDATGVLQTPGQDINDWLKSLVEARATFKAPVFGKARKSDGRIEATVKFGSVAPAA